MVKITETKVNQIDIPQPKSMRNIAGMVWAKFYVDSFYSNYVAVYNKEQLEKLADFYGYASVEEMEEKLKVRSNTFIGLWVALDCDRFDVVTIMPELMEKFNRKFFAISGYFKDDGNESFEMIVTEGDDAFKSPMEDDKIFMYGFSEEIIKEAIELKESVTYGFVIVFYFPTSYAHVML